MRAATEQVRLPFRNRTWRGRSGPWLGVGTGSSIDFQDHRPYLPGDDPRYIDWQAFARTGHYTMKLYREEVSPLVDVVLDVSASMFLDEPKSRRTFELFAFCTESARRSAASLQCFVADAASVKRLPVERVASGEELSAGAAAGPPRLDRVPWRQGSLRVLVSDLLFPGTPAELLRQLSSAKGRGVILAPFTAAETEPDWSGNIELHDCETQRRRVQRVTPQLLEQYRSSYARHFSLWREQARKHAVAIARVDSEQPLLEALRVEALPAGAVEFC
jgi:uncharacterized protein (DUF58 family)